MHARPADAGRPCFDIGEIVRAHGAALAEQIQLTPSQRRALSAIARCRTAALGGHVDVCRSCDYRRPSYNSCRDRHCPKCQALAQERWIARRSERILPVRHFHVVFTLPSELRALGQFRSKCIFDALFRAASKTLLALGRSRLGAQPGVTAVLHTWTRDLRFHPHLHCLVTAGGLAADGDRWVPSSKKYLFPVQVMGLLFRGKMMAELRKLHTEGKFAGFGAFDDPEGFDRLMQRLARINWIVYAKRPFGHADHVLKYLGRYTHRVGISNSRLVSVDVRNVTFRTKDGKTTSVSPVEFLRRFIQHVLPPGFVKIRHYGLLAGANLDRLERARDLLTALPASPAPPTVPMSWMDELLALTGSDVRRCPNCGEELAMEPLPRPPRLVLPWEWDTS